MIFFFSKRGASFPFFGERSVFFGKKKHLFCIFLCIGLLPPLLNPKVCDAGWVFWENLFGFIIRASRSTFLSAAIFDFVKFHFWWLLEGLYGNRTNFKGSVVGHWMRILKRFFHIRDQEVKIGLSVRADFWFCEISFLAIFRGFVWESGQLQRLRVGHWMGVLKRFLQIRDQEFSIDLSICGDFWISQILILVFFKGLYGNWPFSRLKLWDVWWRHRDDVMFFFSFGPWATFLSARIFEFRPKIFFDFSHLFEGPGGKRA